MSWAAGSHEFRDFYATKKHDYLLVSKAREGLQVHRAQKSLYQKCLESNMFEREAFSEAFVTGQYHIDCL